MILERNSAMLLSLVAELAAELERERPSMIVADAAEGYNPVHDLCRFIAGAAIAMCGVDVEQYEYAVVNHPHPPDAAIVVDLDAAEYAAKIERARAHAAVLTDVDELLSRYGEDPYGGAAARPAGARSARARSAPPPAVTRR